MVMVIKAFLLGELFATERCGLLNPEVQFEQSGQVKPELVRNKKGYK